MATNTRNVSAWFVDEPDTTRLLTFYYSNSAKDEEEDHEDPSSFAEYWFPRRLTSSGKSGATDDVIDATAEREKTRRATPTNINERLPAALHIVRANAGEQRGEQEGFFSLLGPSRTTVILFALLASAV